MSQNINKQKIPLQYFHKNLAPKNFEQSLVYHMVDAKMKKDVSYTRKKILISLNLFLFQLPEEHSQALKIVSVVLGLLSITCLCATIFTFLFYRKTLLKDRMIIHFHLIIALFFAYVSILPTSLLASTTAKVCRLQTTQLFNFKILWVLMKYRNLYKECTVLFRFR